jgi:homoserine kinase
MSESTFRMRLPATSANLGSGFDTAAIALDFFLEIEAEPAERFSIEATGKDREVCSRLENNLILSTYTNILNQHGSEAQPLAIRMKNDIPLGMGCGSSAAGILAATAMAAHFGNLNWSSSRILEEACALEGHPDNAAACWLGGFVAAATEGRSVYTVRVEPPEEWRAIVVYPGQGLRTSAARAVLPTSYTTAEVVTNLQSVSLLGLAFAQGRGDLLATAMRDRIHQPYRSGLCPLLPKLLPLAGREGILGIALSGAGPAVLVIVCSETEALHACEMIKAASSGDQACVAVTRFQLSGAQQWYRAEGVEKPVQ